MAHKKQVDAMVAAAAILFAAIMAVTFVNVLGDVARGHARPDQAGADPTAPVSHPGDAASSTTAVGGAATNVGPARKHSAHGVRPKPAIVPGPMAGTTSRPGSGNGGDAPAHGNFATQMSAFSASPLFASVGMGGSKTGRYYSDDGVAARAIVVSDGFGYYLMSGGVRSGAGAVGVPGAAGSPSGDAGSGGAVSTTGGDPPDPGGGQNGSPTFPPAVGGGSGGVSSPVIPADPPDPSGGSGNGGDPVSPSMPPVAVPEPPQMPMMLLGLLGIGGLLLCARWRRQPD